MTDNTKRTPGLLPRLNTPTVANYDTLYSVYERTFNERIEILAAAKLALAWESGENVGPMTSDKVIATLREAISKAEGR